MRFFFLNDRKKNMDLTELNVKDVMMISPQAVLLILD